MTDRALAGLQSLRSDGRLGVALWISALFLAINFATRLALAAMEAVHGGTNLDGWGYVQVLAAGAIHDVAVLSIVIALLASVSLTFPNSRRGRAGFGVFTIAFGWLSLATFLLVATSEVLFWNEFRTRFNFIAVDYLLFTREVLGNVWQSYPTGWLLAAIATATSSIIWLGRAWLWRRAVAKGDHFKLRVCHALIAIGMATTLSMLITDSLREGMPTLLRELSGNGYYDFARAFRNNDLSYDEFYPTVSERRMRQAVWEGLAQGDRTVFGAHADALVEREIVPARAFSRANVILVSMESLGADYVESFGGRKGLTPNLDRLGQAGLRFTNFYATGLRTVRGLEAITLSIPPTPGHAVPMRKRNKGLQSLGGILRELGYQAIYVYGGYSYFDNMRDFFEGNGYEVFDRRNIGKRPVSHENIWGVADEDLFGEVLRIMDERTGGGAGVFIHAMTTSNHRPFTFPEGRVPLASGAGREAAVRYADWALGHFVQQAAGRPWFSDTIFVFVADHTSNGRGRTDLPPENYRIPLVIYSPGLIEPGEDGILASQVDVAPTILGLLGAGYTSRMFGQDLLFKEGLHPRAFMANYLTVGYLAGGRVVELMPKARARIVSASSADDLPLSDGEADLAQTAAAYYQSASRLIRDTAR